MFKSRVLFILPSLHAGGTENYALRFIRYCLDKEFEWHVWSALNERGDLQEEFEGAGCCIQYRSIGYLNPYKAISFVIWLKRKRIDAVVNFNGNFGGMSMFLAKMMGVEKRVVWYHRSSDAFQPNLFKNLYNHFSKRLVRRYATHILSNSQTALDYFFGGYAMNDARFQVIPNGVNAEEYRAALSQEEARTALGLPLKGYIVGHVGRYDPAKNHETIFKVIDRCKRSGLEVSFLFCGKDTDGKAFRSKLSLYGIEDRVHAIGLSQKMALVYRCMDLFYFPSLTEGQPNALLEAMIAGLPFLASDISPIREALPEYAQQRLLPPEDVELALERIRQEKLQKWDKTYHLQEWAVQQYDTSLHYKRFKNILHGY